MRLFTPDVAQKLISRSIESFFIDAVEHTLTMALLASVGGNRPQPLKLPQVPKYGPVVHVQCASDVTRSRPLGVLPQESENGRPERVYPQGSYCGLHSLGERC